MDRAGSQELRRDAAIRQLGNWAIGRGESRDLARRVFRLSTSRIGEPEKRLNGLKNSRGSRDEASRQQADARQNPHAGEGRVS